MPRPADESTIAHISTPPPTPHALALAIIILNLFPPMKVSQDETDKWLTKNSAYVQQSLNMLAREIFHLSEPSTYLELQEKVHRLLDLAPNKEDEFVKRPCQQLNRMPEIFDDVQQSFEMIDNVPAACYETPEDGPGSPETRITYHSPLGVFLRKVHLAYRVLNFPQSLIVRQDVLSWCAGDPEPSFRRQDERAQKQDQANSSDAQNLVSGWSANPDALHDDMEDEQRWNGHGGIGYGYSMKKGKRRVVANKVTEMDDLLDTRLSVLQEYQTACKSGDYSLALSSLEKFYSHRFPPNDKMRHHHALLQLASYHYATGGLELAKDTIDEAIRGARTAGDAQCLKHCLSLAKRLKAESEPAMSTVMAPGQPVHTSDVGENAVDETPLDELWAVKQRLDLGESLPTAYAQTVRAIARQQSIMQAKSGPKPAINSGLVEPESEQEIKDRKIPEGSLMDDGLLHVVQSGLWEMMGSPTLAELHEDLALRSSTNRTDISLAVAMGRSRRYTKASRSSEALAILLDPHLTEGMTIADFHKWSEAIWDVLEQDLQRREEDDMLDLVKTFRLPQSSYRQLGAGGPLRILHDPGQKLSHDLFERDAMDSPRRGIDVLTGLLARAEAAEAHGAAPLAALPHLLKASHISLSLQHWVLHRTAIVRLAHVISRLEGSTNPFRQNGEKAQSLLAFATRQLESVWFEITRSDDDDVIWISNTIMLRYQREQGRLDRYERYSKPALRSAFRLQSRSRVMDTLMIISLIEDDLGNDTRRDRCADLWNRLDQGFEMEIIARHFDYVREPSLANLGMASGKSPQYNGYVTGTADFVQEIRDIILRTGTKIAAAM